MGNDGICFKIFVVLAIFLKLPVEWEGRVSDLASPCKLISCWAVGPWKIAVVSYQCPSSYFGPGLNWAYLGHNMPRTRTEAWVKWWRSVEVPGKAMSPKDEECRQCDLGLNSRGRRGLGDYSAPSTKRRNSIRKWDGSVYKKMPGSTVLELSSAVEDVNSNIVLACGWPGHLCSLLSPFAWMHFIPGPRRRVL